MKISAQNQLVKCDQELVFCFDVAKDKLNLFARVEQGDQLQTLEDELPNKTQAIEAMLHYGAMLSNQLERRHLRIVCEPSGGFEQKLLQTARRLGHKTALVSGEHVAKLKSVESNDTGKTDIKDPRVMEMIVRLGKAQRHRVLPPIYRRLRHLNRFYDAEEHQAAALRQRILALIRRLFPDYDKSPTWTFDNSGCALMNAYAFNPYQIVRAGYTRFQAKMKRHVRFIRFATLEHLFACAQSSVRYRVPEEEMALLVMRLQQFFDDWRRHRKRLVQLRKQIEVLGRDLQRQGQLPHLDRHIKGLSLFNLARVAGETGPLEDFHSKRAILRYGGLNLRRRQSGTYKGLTRISKKGRPLLRKILAQTTFPLLKRRALYGEIYHRKREQGMAEQKAKVAIMRKFLVMLYGVHKSGQAFDPRRLYRCQSQMNQAA